MPFNGLSFHYAHFRKSYGIYFSVANKNEGLIPCHYNTRLIGWEYNRSIAPLG